MSLSISSTTSSATWATAAATATPAAASGGSRQERVPGHVTAAAEVLRMDSSDVMSSLKSGQSLFDIADEQGVSRDDLLAALKADAPQDLKDSADVDAMIEALASTGGVGGPGGVETPQGAAGPSGGGDRQGPPPPPPGQATGVLGGSMTSSQRSTLSALSDLLGTDSGSLLTQLQSGTDLTDLLSAKGVSLDQLSTKLEEGLLYDAKA